MNNYYENCIASIEASLSEGEITTAQQIIDQELAMPFVPEPYFSTLKNFRDELNGDRHIQSQYFDSFDDIVKGLLGNDLLKHKALMSITRLNLRAYLDDIRQVLTDTSFESWVKRHIVFCLMDQEVKGSLDIKFETTTVTVTIEDLINPIGTEIYDDCVRDLAARLESWNPSLYLLCIDELDQRMLEHFPLPQEAIAAETIINAVNQYMNAV